MRSTRNEEGAGGEAPLRFFYILRALIIFIRKKKGKVYFVKIIFLFCNYYFVKLLLLNRILKFNLMIFFMKIDKLEKSTD